MTIETKYNIGDKVWFTEEGDAKCEEILGIEVNVYKDKLFIEYLFANDSYPYGLNGSALFPTKEELLKVCRVCESRKLMRLQNINFSILGAQM